MKRGKREFRLIRRRNFLRTGQKSGFSGFWLILLIVLLPLSGCENDNTELQTIPSGEKIEQYDVPFEQVPETPDIAMYEVNTQVFSRSGNFKGIEGRLDSIKNLGINVIWLMPIYPVGVKKSVGSPYCVKDYTTVNSDYGTLDDLRELVKEAHRRNMAVILDWVANHTSWDNDWIENKSWYTQDSSGNIMSPEGEGWSDVADLNYSNTDMRKAMIQAMKYWVLTANVDGYRCDYAEGVPSDFWKQAIDTLRDIPNRKIIMFAEASDQTLYSAGFNLIFGWNYYSKLKSVFEDNTSANGLYAVNAADNTNLTSNSSILRFTSNHDYDSEATPITVFNGFRGAQAAFVLTVCMGGVPLIYNGQEIGCPVKLSFFNTATTKIDWSIHPDIRTEYKQLMALRNSNDAVKYGLVKSLGSNSDVIAFVREYAGSQVVVIVNVRNDAIDYQLPLFIENSGWVNALTGKSINLADHINLKAYSYLILKNVISFDD